MKQTILITFLFLCLSTACTQQSQNQKISQTNTPKSIQNELCTHIPVGTVQKIIEKTPITEQTITCTPKKQEKTTPTATQKSINTETFKSIADLYKKLEKAPQTFSLSTNTQQKIICEQGTVITIPENAFINEKTGEPIKEKVSIKIKEYYKKSDFLTANLTTQTKDAILETGGTIHIEAFANGQKCALQKEIEIAFPYENQKEGMQPFEGKRDEQGQMIWEAMETPNLATNLNDNKAEKTSLRQQIRKNRNSKNPSQSSKPIVYTFHKITNISKNIPYPYTALKDNQEGTIEAVFQTNNEADIKNIRITQRLCPSLDKTAYYIISNLQEYYEEKLIENACYKIPITFRSGDKKIKRPSLKSSPYQSYHKKKKSTKEKTKPTPNSPYTTKTIEEAKAFEEIIKDIEVVYSKAEEKKISASERLKRIIKDKKHKIDASLISQYILHSSKLGWINCDRFYRTKTPKIDYFVNIDQKQNIDIKIIFHKMDAILRGSKKESKYVFSNVPSNQPITVFAIKQRDGQNYIALQETKTQINNKLKLDFQPVTFEQLEEKIKVVNRL